MAHDRNTGEAGQVLPNLPGFTDARELAVFERRMAAYRIAQLSRDPLQVVGDFDFAHLQRIHRFILQDVYPWAGQLRTAGQNTTAMGLIHCRPEYLPNMIDTVFTQIAENRPSSADVDAAVATVAEHWGELTGVHPFQDGNSRTQRFFFTEYARESGWALNWNAIDDTAVHAARHVAMATTDSSYLAEALRPGIEPVTATSHSGADGAAAEKDASKSFTMYQQMRAHRRAGGTAAEFFADPTKQTPTAAEIAARLGSRGFSRRTPTSQWQGHSSRPSHSSAASTPKRDRGGTERGE